MTLAFLSNILLVGLGGGIGAILRYGTSEAFKPIFQSENNALYATFTANILGALLIGLSMAYFYKHANETENLKLFLNIGILGGFTTFSTFSLENIALFHSGQYLTAGLYIIASLFICLTLCALGLNLGKTIF